MYLYDQKVHPKYPGVLRSWASFDRTRILFDLPTIVDVRRLGVVTDVRPFSVISDTRAKQIVAAARAQKKRIFVMWSGGIDSTVAFTALQKFADVQELCVLYRPDSKTEYPELYERIVAAGHHMKELSCGKKGCTGHCTVDDTAKEDIVVTGEIGDQLFGNQVTFNYEQPEMVLKDWRYFHALTNPDFVDRLELFVACSPVEIKTLKDFFWWWNYAVNYQGVALRIPYRSPSCVLEQNTFHFFDTDEFNDWAVSTPMEQKLEGANAKRYKMDAKQYIYDVQRDLDYLENKTKVPSLNEFLTVPGKGTRLTTDWVWE